VQPLNKAQNRNTWEVAARAAFEAGAVEDIADVCARFASDAEMFKYCISCLTSMTNVPKCLPALMASAPTVALIVQAVGTYAQSLDMSSPSSFQEAIGYLQPALSLLLAMARHDGTAFEAAGGIKLLLDMASSAASPTSGRPKSGSAASAAKALEAYAGYIASVVNILDRATRSKGGLDALAGTKEYVTKLLRIAAMNLQGAASGGGDVGGGRPKSVRGSTAGVDGGGKDIGGGKDLNVHLEPAFRILDRLARTEAGRDMLVAADALNALSPIMGVVLKSSTVGPLAMRVLARLLGSNVPELIDRIAGVNPSGGAPPALTERVMCARLLAFMLRDEEYRAILMANEAALLRRVIDLVDKAPLAQSDGSVALVQVLRRLAEAKTDHIPVLEEAGAIGAVVSLLAARQDSAEVVSECVGFFASLIDCPEMVVELTRHSAGNVIGLAASAVLKHIDNAAAAYAGLRLMENALVHEHPAESLVSLQGHVFVIDAMREHSGELALQIVATDVLVYLACCEAHVDAMVASGVVPVVIRNLRAGSDGGAGDASGTGIAAGGSGDQEDEDGAPVGGRAGGARSAELVASSLYLVTSLCAVERHLPAAKAAGIIRAVLSGFSRHTHDTNVYRNFREVISALNITEEEVTDAVKGIVTWTGILQAAYGEREIFKAIEDYTARVTGEGSDVFTSARTAADMPAREMVRNAKGEPDMNHAAEKVLENISLLEAVTVSPVFVCVVTANDGVPALLKVLGVLSVVKVLAAAKAAAGKGAAAVGRGAAPGGAARSFVSEKGVACNLLDDVMSRACNTLAHVARVAYEIGGGQVEQDAEYEPVDFEEFGIGEQLHGRDTVTIVARGMLSSAKPNLRQFAVASITLMSWLASGHSQSEVRDHVDAVIGAQGIEGVVAMLRAHQASIETCAAAAGALTRISVSPKGATAVATRGGSRQIIRMLHSTAALQSNAGDELLLAYLRLMDTCAAGGAESADILRRQGLVDAVVACTDAGTDRDFRGEDEEDVAPAAAPSEGGAAAPYVPDVAVRADIDATITSILSRLVGPETVTETVAQLEQYAAELSKQAVEAAYTGKRPLVLSEYQKARMVRAVVRLGLLATTDAGIAAGTETLQRGAQVLATLSEISIRVGKVVADLGLQQLGVIEQELEATLPCALRSIKQLVNAMYVAAPGEAAAAVGPIAKRTIPVLLQALEEKPGIAKEAVGCASVLTSSDAAAALFVKAHDGKALALLVEVFRAAAERGDEDVVRDVVLTLAGIAKVEANLASVVNTGVVAIAQQFLNDNVNEAKPDTLAATFLLLAHTSADPSIVHDLVANGHVFELIRTSLQRYCSDAYNPREPLLYSISKLMQKLSHAYGVVTDPAHGEDYRNALKRVMRAAAGSTGYIDSPRCGAAILNAITLSCTPDDSLSADLVRLNREAVEGAGGEDLIVQCMSSYAATQEVLDAGYAALQALGASERAKQLVEQIDSYAATIPQWLESGYSCESPEVIDMVASMSDLMKSLASQIVVSSGRIPELGSSYADVLATCWRAVAVVCRPDVSSVRSTPSAPQPTGAASGKDMQQSRADVLAVGAQIAGRLEAASQVAAASEGAGGPHAVPLSDLVNVLYTILATGHSVVEVRVVESLGRAAEQVVEHMGEGGVHALCTGKVVAGLVSLLQVVHSEVAKARLAAAGGSFGVDAEATLSIADLGKCEAAIVTTVKNTVSRLRAAFAGKTSGVLLQDAEAVSDIMTALAISTAPSETAGSAASSAAAGGEDGEDGSAPAPVVAAPLVDASPASELNQLADAIVKSALKAAPDGSAAWAVLHKVSDVIAEAMTGPAKHGAAGKAPLYAITTLQSHARVQSSLMRAITSLIVPPGDDPVKATMPANVVRVGADVAAVVSAVDVAVDVGRKGRTRIAAGATALEANKEPTAAEAAAAAPDAVSEYEGTEAEQVSVKSAYTVAAAVSINTLRSALELLARLDASSGVAAGVSEKVTEAGLGQALCFLFGNKGAVDSGAALSAVRAVSRLSDLYAKDVLSGAPVANPARTARILALGSLGIYRSAVNGLTNAAIAENEAYVVAVVSMIAKLLRLTDVKTLGLDKQSLLSLNAAMRRHPENDALLRDIPFVVKSLEAIYQEQSGAAFEGSIKGTLSALTGAKGYQRFMSPDAKIYYTKDGGSTSWDAPAPVIAMMDAMSAVDMMSRKLEEEAVTAVNPEVINGMVATLRAHEHDPGIVGVMLNALGKLAANADNHDAILNSAVLESAVNLFRTHGHLKDPRVCEGLASLILPLSFEQQFVKTVLTDANVIPLLIEIIVKYNRYCTTYALSPLAWPPSGDYNARVAALKADTPDADERNKELPRLAQMCVQSLANLACDNEADETGESSVTRIVACGGVEALGELMSLHLDNPRLLEDSICALSNMAFVSDTIQLSIGRSCMDTVCTAATRFNSDSYLFQMTLRAIGNLTRCDENIMRAVGYGVIRGMVDGMSKHSEDPSVLQLCADVIGNMASVDDKKVGRAEGVRILMECSAKRGKTGPAPAAAAPPTPTPPPPKPGTPAAPAAPNAAKVPRPPNHPKTISNEQLMAVVEKAESLKEAVCTVLYEDGAPRALVEAMTKHYRNADLAGSCLRAMHYIGASKELVTRMVDELALVDQVVYIMRSIDYRPDVLRRGARVLGLVVGTDNLKDKVLMAGAPVMLLQAIETHKAERELCISCYSVLAMARSGAVVSAVQEMQAVDTAVTILRLNASDHEFVGVLLELLWGWAAEADLASTIAARAGPTLTQLLEAYAKNTAIPDRLQHLNYILNLMIALVRQRVEPTLLTGCGLVPASQVVVEGIIGSSDGNVMLQQRSLVMQTVTVMMEMAKPQPKDKDTPAVVSTPGVEALIGAGAGPMLEKILTAYKAVPDPRVPGQLLYDQSMCERVHGVLQDMIAHGYAPVAPVTLDAPEDGDAPPAPAPAAAVPAPAPASAPAAGPVPTPPPPRAAPVAASASAGAGAAPAAPVLPLDAQAELGAMMSPAGRALDIWTADGKPRRARMAVSADRATISVAFEDGKREQAQFASAAVRGVLLNVPTGFKKRGGLFGGGRQPLPQRSVVLEDREGNTIFHLEVESDALRGALATAFSALAGVAARA